MRPRAIHALQLPRKICRHFTQKLVTRAAAGFTDLARMGSKDKTFYIPWMQATYVMAVNKRRSISAAGADVNALTYQQLKDWGAAITKATNKRLIGFPAGPTACCSASSRATCIRRNTDHRAWPASSHPKRSLC